MENLSLDKIKQNELHKLEAFFKTQYTGTEGYGSAALFDWKIFKNPNGTGTVYTFNSNGTVASSASITQKLLIAHKSILKSAEIGDTFTHQDFQRKGLFANLVNQASHDALSSDIKLIFGTPNNQSLPGYLKKTGFQIIESLKVRSWRLPTSLFFLKQKYKWLPSFILITLNFWLEPFYKISIFLINLASPRNLSIETASKPPEDWEQFITEFHDGYDLVFCRSKDHLNWRYFESPNNYRFLRLSYDKNTIGYAVLRQIPDLVGLKLVVADFGIKKEFLKYFKFLFFKIVSIALTSNIHSIIGWISEDSSVYPLFRNLGICSKDKIPVIGLVKAGQNELNLSGKWHFTIGDSDNI